MDCAAMGVCKKTDHFDITAMPSYTDAKRIYIETKPTDIKEMGCDNDALTADIEEKRIYIGAK
jgi:hypothetical protein